MLGTKTIRHRSAPIRKWQKYEERTLVDFLLNNAKDFEKPTAQMYYRKFMYESQMKNIEWKLIRAKVRNMRTVYIKAKRWKNTAEAGELNEASVKENLLKIFYFYEEFDKIFDDKRKTDVSISAEDSINSDFIKEELSIDNSDHDHQHEETYSSRDDNIMPDATDNYYINHEDSNTEDEQATNLKPSASNVLSFKAHTGETDSCKMISQLTYAHTLKEAELKLQRDRLEFEKEKLRQELTVRKKEIESQERLKILELEMKERIAMSELKMKENVALKALERKFDFNEL
ncbi:uncharacterized protein [Musca autumnalis]|uniref:uncharacterized protein n=1 Tax=Musca autumnalis TaxID=221902 RepID=UPI003CF63C0A